MVCVPGFLVVSPLAQTFLELLEEAPDSLCSRISSSQPTCLDLPRVA